VTISNLQPSTTYYYRPEIHATVKGFGTQKVRRATAIVGVKQEEIKIKWEDMEEDETEDEFDQRRLIKHPPYSGWKKPCPSSSKIRSFRTAPVPGSDGPLNFAIVGDLGQFSHSEETMARLIRSKGDIEVMILAGDIGYGEQDHRHWDTFFDFLDDFPLAEDLPIQICPGNHDIDKLYYDNSIFLAYEHRFRMPRIKPAELGIYDGPLGHMNMDKPPYPMPYEYGNAYYAFTYGPARMIMLSAYSAMEPDSLQYKWLVEELASVDRSITPWLLVTIHTPFYNTFSHHQRDPQIFAARKHVEPLLVEYKVNLVFTGHIHAYLRTANIALGRITPTGPMHITVGAGGRSAKRHF
jgi:hypothetical protein